MSLLVPGEIVMSHFQALIIDDNALNIDVLIALLENSGGQTAAIESPRQIPDVLAALDRVDVVFLDLEFPNHDGFILLGELRTQPRLQGVPIVAYSVHTSEIDEARQAGFDGFIGKPLDARRFPEQLERILNGQAVWEV